MPVVPGWAGIQGTLRPPPSCVPSDQVQRGTAGSPPPTPVLSHVRTAHTQHTRDTICSHSGTGTLQTTSLGSMKGPLQNIRTNISSIKEFADIHSQPFLSILHPAEVPAVTKEEGTFTRHRGAQPHGYGYPGGPGGSCTLGRNQVWVSTPCFREEAGAHEAHRSLKGRGRPQASSSSSFSKKSVSVPLSTGISKYSTPSVPFFVFISLWSLNSVSWARSVRSLLTRKASRHCW